MSADLVTSCPAPPKGQGWLHEIKHDGYRLLPIVAGDDAKLINRNDHTAPSCFAPFDKLAAAGLPLLVVDGEIPVPDDRGVTHIDLLSEVLQALSR